MSKQILLASSRLMAAANDNDALVPELWSREALLTLMSNTIMVQLVNKDFSSDIQSHGDVVNTSRPADFAGIRKTDADNVTDQDAESPNIAVPLNQHFHVSYVIKDGELTKALPDLLTRYMEPAARELAEKVDQCLVGQAARLAGNQVGQPDASSELNVDGYIADADEKLNDNRAPKFGRYLVMSSRFNRNALGADLIVSAEKRGDEGTALRDASVGKIYGFDSFMNQNVAQVAIADCDLADDGVKVTDGAQVKGDTVIATTLTTTEVVTAGGEYVVIDGSEYAHRTASAADDTGDADLTLTEAITADVASGADVWLFKAMDTNGTQAAGYAKAISIDGFDANKGPQVGQRLTWGTGASSHSYTVIRVVAETSTTEWTVLLDRPLDSAITNNDLVYPGPAGSANLAFTRDAITLVTRPLANVPAGSGASSSVASFDGLSLRVTTQYDSQAQGTRVTFDLLCGVAILDARLACVVNG
jgi:hypothetical protein